jgi:hypothetical protein
MADGQLGWNENRREDSRQRGAAATQCGFFAALKLAVIPIPQSRERNLALAFFG